MQGLGDNLHQRAVIRQLLASGYEIWLQTPWPNVYHDLVGPNLHLAAADSRLRTQAKNERTHRALLNAAPPRGIEERRAWYSPQDVRKLGSVLGAMLANCGCEPTPFDFRLPVPTIWQSELKSRLRVWPSKPILFFRPLVDRKEWGGCKARNPDEAAYAQLFAAIRSKFFVVSVADLVPNQEWLVGPRIIGDVEFHAGELTFEELAALARLSALVFCSPGFATVLAQAVETPLITVFGGYENSRSFSLGAKLSSTLGVDPIGPCECFRHDHACDKRIDLSSALRDVMEYADAALANHQQIGNSDDRTDRLEWAIG
jgi:ADP-heptose:LPS heptosyltransferase